MHLPAAPSLAEEFLDRARVLVPKAGAVYSAVEIYRSAAGFWIDPDWLTALPPWTGIIVLDNPIWRWIAVALAAAALVIAVLARLAYRWDMAREAQWGHRRLGRLHGSRARLAPFDIAPPATAP